MKRTDLKRGDIVGVRTSKGGLPTKSVVVDAGAWGEIHGTAYEYARSTALQEREAEKITVEVDGVTREIKVEPYLYRKDSSQAIITMTINGALEWVHLTQLRHVEGFWTDIVAEQERRREEHSRWIAQDNADIAAREALAKDLMGRLGIVIAPNGYNGDFKGKYVNVTLEDLQAIADRYTPTA